MICPYPYQYIRRFQTQYSRQRPFSIFQGDNKPSVEEAYRIVQNGRWDSEISDDVRILWELLNLDGKKTRFSNLPWVRNFFKEHTILGAMTLFQIGTDIMNNKPALRWVYGMRLEKLAEKIARIHGQKPGLYIGDLYDIRGRQFLDELTDLESTFANGKQRPYDTEDVLRFQDLTEAVIKDLCQRYGVGVEEFERYLELFKNREEAPTQPFEHDSIPMNPLKILKIDTLSLPTTKSSNKFSNQSL